MTIQARYDAFMRRDRDADGDFVIAVTSTGIYCRPSCPARRPKRRNIRFYDLPEAAVAAGFRACKRCRPDRMDFADPQARAVRRAARAIEDHLADGPEGPPRLADLATAAGLSAHHLQRTFKRLVGLSPKDYAEARRTARLKAGLKAGNGVADAVYGAGYGSSSRVYEKAGRALGMTPGAYARGGPGADLRFAIARSRLGRVLVAATNKGVAAVYLGDGDAALKAELAAEYPKAALRRDEAALGRWVGALVRYLDGEPVHPDLPLDVRATAFQWRVWRELLAIPYGETRTYAEIAAALGRPKAARAVGRACATNEVSLAIPCHRVVSTSGGLQGYRWGVARKRALLEMEKAGAAKVSVV